MAHLTALVRRPRPVFFTRAARAVTRRLLCPCRHQVADVLGFIRPRLMWPELQAGGEGGGRAGITTLPRPELQAVRRGGAVCAEGAYERGQGGMCALFRGAGAATRRV